MKLRRRGENHQLLKATMLPSCSPSTFVLFIWEDRSKVLSSSEASLPQFSLYCSFFQNYLGSSTFQATWLVSPCRVERWFRCVELRATPAVLLPGVDQLFSEPAGQRLTHPVEQLGQLNVVIPIVLPEEHLGLKQTKEVS